ncbi:MAG: hypothetical protein HC869_07085 [Rhodospirillales bacterium]|nr:hypothetical protein [Rhodospirillales bacterium]
MRTQIEVSPAELSLFKAGWKVLRSDSEVMRELAKLKSSLADTPEELLMSGSSDISKDLEILRIMIMSALDQRGFDLNLDQKKDFFYFCLNADIGMLEG